VDVKYAGPPKSELPTALAVLMPHRVPARPFPIFLGEIQPFPAFSRVEKISIWQTTKPRQTSRLSHRFLLFPIEPNRIDSRPVEPNRT
jgi:hypothetical protein